MIKYNEILNNKALMIGGIVGVMAILFIITFLLIEASKDHSVKEVFFDNQKKEVFTIRDDNVQKKLNVKMEERDSFFRSNEFLIHQQLKKGQEGFHSYIYKVNVKSGLTKVFEHDGNILSFQNEQNFVYEDGNKTIITKDNTVSEYNDICRSADVFEGSFICITKSGKLVGGEPSNIKEIPTSNLFSITFSADKKGKKLYFAFATQEDLPKNYVSVVSSLNDFDNPLAKYEIDEIPVQFTVQDEGVVLNARMKPANEGQALNEFKLYRINGSLNRLEGYRYTLTIVY